MYVYIYEINSLIYMNVYIIILLIKEKRRIWEMKKINMEIKESLKASGYTMRATINPNCMKALKRWKSNCRSNQEWRCKKSHLPYEQRKKNAIRR